MPATGVTPSINRDAEPRPRRWYQRSWLWLILAFAGILLWFVVDVTIFVWRGAPDLFPQSTSLFTANGTAPAAVPVDMTRLIRDNSPSLGLPPAAVTIVEFADFECPYCEQAFPIIRGLAAEYGDRIHVVFRYFPVPSLHEHAMAAAVAAACADSQGKFWAYHDKLFQNQDALDDTSLQSYAVEIGLDAKTFASCVSSREQQSTVMRDISDGNALGVGGTPTWFVNGRKIEGVISRESFHKAIEALLKAANK